MTAARQTLFWLGGFALFLAAVYLFRGILLPFVVGMAVAYFLDPAADRLERWGLSRWLAATAVLALFFLAGAALVVVLAPLIRVQLVELVEAIPALVAWLRDKVLPLVEGLYARIPAAQLEDLRAAAGGFAGDVIARLGGVAGSLWSGGVALVNLLSLVIVTPIVAFYLVRDWDRLVARIDGWLPKAHAAVIREQVRRIDATLAGFVRGTAMVCLILAFFYAAALTLIGLKSGLVVGIGAGLISFVPFVGAFTGFIVATGLALFQFSDWVPVALVAGTFVVGQGLEGNLLTPKLVGDRIGLHPVWVIFALFAGGALFGFTGVLLAIPVAASIGVLGRFALGRYLESPLYLGRGKTDPGGTDPGGTNAGGTDPGGTNAGGTDAG